MFWTSLTALSLPQTQILSATTVPASGPLLAYCNVVGVIDKRVSAQDPDHFTYDIGFQLNLPDQWVGRFEMRGGGGTDESVRNPIGSAGTELSRGWAVAADDGGPQEALRRSEERQGQAALFALVLGRRHRHEWLVSLECRRDPALRAAVEQRAQSHARGGAVPMVFATPPVITPLAGPNGQEAFIFHYNFDTDAPKIDARTRDYPESAMEFMTGVSPDLHRFKRHGGKLIIYDSVNDGIFSGVDSADYYERMNEVMGGRAQSFARLFMVPHMGHCGGGRGTTSFSATMLTAITDWVENGVAPDRIVAANTSTTSPCPSGGLREIGHVTR